MNKFAIRATGPSSLASPLRLPCGASIPNRLAKAAMTEGLADCYNAATEAHVRLYERWAAGGPGLLITGNVMVDRRQLERAGNVAIEPDITAPERSALQRWAAAGKRQGAALWMQLSHAGRQTPKAVNAQPDAPSAVPVQLPGKKFGVPRELRSEEIEALVQRFVHAAVVARDCGFTGVQFHSAHGYLLSEFLSPRANRRSDEWGGSLENRARLLLSIVRAARRSLGDDFPISVKLNTSDFQRGGFYHAESLTVIPWLAEAGVDLLELSGGTYEQPNMMGLGGILEPQADAVPAAIPSGPREGYFPARVASVLATPHPPLMVTGGFRTRTGMLGALAEGVELIGLARPLCTQPELPAQLLAGSVEQLPCWENRLELGRGWLSRRSPFPLVKLINGFGLAGWYYEQLLRMGAGREPDTTLSLWSAFMKWHRGEAAAARALRPRAA